MSLIKNYLHQLQNMNRDQLQNDYIESIVDGMDHKDMWQFVYDTLEQNLEKYSDEELVTEVKDYYPHFWNPASANWKQPPMIMELVSDAIPNYTN